MPRVIDIMRRALPANLAAFESGDALLQVSGITQPGDGYRYRVRGILQTTARGNYRRILDRRKSSMTNWPHQSECARFYGNPGRVELVKLTPPYRLFYDGKPIDFFYIHPKCHDSAMRVLTRVKEIYGDRIHDLGLDRYDGCYNPRKMRGGNAWSMHAYGCAIDWDAARNQFREDHRTARFARPEYKDWLDAWEAEGWVSLGRARDFDWMHVQAARL